MIFLFKSTIILCQSNFVLAAFVFYHYTVVDPFPLSRLMGYLFVLFWFASMTLVLDFIVSKRIGIRGAWAVANCEIQPHIVYLENLLTKWSPRKVRGMLYVLLSNAYAYAGNEKELFYAANRASELLGRDASPYQRLFLYGHCLTYYLRKDDIANAEKYFALYQEMANNQKVARRYPMIRDGVAKNQFQLRMAKGDFAEAEQHFSQRLAKAESRNDKTSATYTLGKIYLHDGKNDKAKEAFTYAAENGGDTFQAKKSKEYLRQLALAPM